MFRLFQLNSKRTSIVAAGSFAAIAGLALANTNTVHANDALTPPAYPWEHNSVFKGLDMKSVRRGYQVYKDVCASCHSLSLIAYRNFVGTIATEEEAKAWAADIAVEDGPDDKGEMFERPGKLADYLPKPYANDNAARAANAGALPPDLSLIEKARPGGADYLMALLNGYSDPPEHVQPREGMYYNPYFPGEWIGMPQPLFDGMVEYEDGTPNNQEQLAKDVVTFLTWAAEPEFNDRKRMGLQAMFLLSVMLIPSLYFKRMKWSVLKHRKLRFTKLD